MERNDDVDLAEQLLACCYEQTKGISENRDSFCITCGQQYSNGWLEVGEDEGGRPARGYS